MTSARPVEVDLVSNLCDDRFINECVHNNILQRDESISHGPYFKCTCTFTHLLLS